MDQLVFTAEQIEAILDEFIQLLADDVFINILKTSGQSEFAIVSQLIEDRQRKIFEDHGVDATQGFQDMSKIKNFYPKDHPICRKLFFVAMREEAVTNFAIISPNNPEYQLSVPASVDEMEKKNLEKFPQVMSALQEQLRKNPAAIQQMTPQQQAMIAQMIRTQQALQAQGQYHVPTQQPAHAAAAPRPELDFTRPGQRNMDTDTRDDDPFASK